MKIQLDIPNEVNKKLKIYKVINGKKTLAEAANEIIEKGVDFEYIKTKCATIGDLQKLDEEVRNGKNRKRG